MCFLSRDASVWLQQRRQSRRREKVSVEEQRESGEDNKRLPTQSADWDLRNCDWWSRCPAHLRSIPDHNTPSGSTQHNTRTVYSCCVMYFLLCARALPCVVNVIFHLYISVDVKAQCEKCKLKYINIDTITKTHKPFIYLYIYTAWAFKGETTGRG